MIRDPGYFEKMGSESGDPDPQNSHMDPEPRIRDPCFFFFKSDPKSGADKFSDLMICRILRISDIDLGSCDPSDLIGFGIVESGATYFVTF